MCHFPAAVKREASVEAGDTIAFLYANSGHVPNQDACPESGLPSAQDMQNSKVSGASGRCGRAFRARF